MNAIRVLVIDDDLEVAAGIARRLEGAGAIVATASDPVPLVPELEGRGAAWDVILADAELPAMSGLALLERVRAGTSLASVVLLTGDDSIRTATAHMRAGAFYYLIKPFRPMEMSAIVESAARFARLRGEHARLHATPPAELDARAPQPMGSRPQFFGESGEMVSLAEGKRAAAATFERDYLVRVMWIAKGSIAEGARLAGIDRTNFRRLLHRHEIDATEYR